MGIYSALVSMLAFVSTLSGGLLAAKLRGRFGALDAFAAGVLIAVPLFDLLPESLKLASDFSLPLTRVLHTTALGFLFVYIIERYFSVHRVCDGNVCKNVHHQHWGWVGAAELSLHSFMDGLAIGVGFQLDVHVGIIVTMAVISHDFSDGINTVTVMLTAGNSLRSSLTMLLADAIAPVLGALSTQIVQIPQQDLVLVLPFFAGGFIYLGASDLLPEAHEENPPLVSVASCLAGFLVIYLVTRFLNV